MSPSRSRRGAHVSSVPAVLLLALASWLTTPAARAAESPYALHIDPATLRADARGMWEMRVRFANRSASGAYSDSLIVEWTSDARGTDGAPASGRTDLSGLARTLGATSANDSAEVSISFPAECARGRLTVHLWLHDAKKQVSSVSAEASVIGSDLDDFTPTTLLTAAGRAVELILVRPDSAAWPAPTLLVLPPAGVRARSLVRWSLGLVQRGHAVALLGPPGTGGSQGPDDHSGPASVAAVAAALAQLGREAACDAHRTLLWGEAEGASTALLSAASQKNLAGVVSLDARMDPWADYRAMNAAQQSAYLAAAGRDSAAWRARSALEVASRISAPVLVLHTDRAGPAGAAAQFVQRRADAGLPVESRLNGQDSRPLRRPDTARLWMDFVTRMTRAAKP